MIESNRSDQTVKTKTAFQLFRCQKSTALTAFFKVMRKDEQCCPRLHNIALHFPVKQVIKSAKVQDRLCLFIEKCQRVQAHHQRRGRQAFDNRFCSALLRCGTLPWAEVMGAEAALAFGNQ